MKYLLILIFSILIGYRPIEFGSDYENYISLYYESGISEPLYLLLNNIFLWFGFEAEFFIFIVSLISGILFTRGIDKINIEYEYKVIAYGVFWFLLMSAHFRSGVAVSFYLYFLGTNFYKSTIAAFLHYSYIFISFISIVLDYFRNKLFFILLFIVTCVFIIFQEKILEIFSDFLIIMGRERNYLALNDLLVDNYEHRSLWHINNLKNYLCLFYLIISIFFVEDKLKSVLIKIPNLSYLMLGFDAYLAEKTFLASYPLLCIGISGIDNKYIKKIIFFITFTIVVRDILGRFSIIDLSPAL